MAIFTKLKERLKREAGSCEDGCGCSSNAENDLGDFLPDLSWVPEWIDRVRDFVHVRAEDNLFIQRPNKAFKLNYQAVAILERLFAGETLSEILAPHGSSPRVWNDVERFLLDLRKLLREGLEDTYESSAVDKIEFTMEFSKLPVLSEVAITYRCNAACTFCYAGCNCTVNPVGNDEEMSADEIKRVLDRIVHEAQVPSISFTGGEATLRPELPDLISYARSLGMRVNLITNGIKASVKTYAHELVDAGLHSAQVSIEGTDAETHEAVTQIAHHFKRATNAVRNFKELGINVHTNTTITQTNLHDVGRFPDFVNDELGLDTFSMNLVIPTGSAPENGGLQVTYTEVGPVLQRIQARSLELGVKFMWYSPTPMCIFNPIVEGLGNKGCSACDGLISVGADGQVIPCASYDEPLGDLRDTPFQEIWQSNTARSFREKGRAHAICHACDNFHICNGACPLYWRVQGYDELLAAQQGRSRGAIE